MDYEIRYMKVAGWLACLVFPSSLGTWPATGSLQLWLISDAEGSIAVSVLWTLSLPACAHVMWCC